MRQAGQPLGARPAAMICSAPSVSRSDGQLAGVTCGSEDEHVCPAWNCTRWRSATQEDMAGFMAAATARVAVRGQDELRRMSMTVCSAIAPTRASGRTK